jgi:Ca2+-transporting ATPase
MTTLSVGKTTPSAKAARQSVEHVANEFNADPSRGLYSSDVIGLRALYGSNELEAEDEESIFSKFIDSFKDPLILLLLGSAVVSVIMGQIDDAISITVVNYFTRERKKKA